MKKFIGRLLILLVILAVAVLAASGILGSRLNRRDSSAFSADLVGFENADFAAAGRGFAAVSEISCRLYGGGGEILCSASRSYPNVQIIGAESYAAVWSEGDPGLTILRPGEPADLSFPGGVTAADINDAGTTAVLAGENVYKGSVSVIREDGTALYRVYVGSGYPVDTGIAPDSRHVAILSLTATGSQLSIYVTDREDSIAEVPLEDVACFDLEYLRDGRILLVSSDRLLFLKGDGSLLGEYTFNGQYLRDYACGGEGFVVLLLGEYKAGSAGRILLLDTEGNLLCEKEITSETNGLSASGKRFALRFSDETLVFDSALTELGRLQSTAGVQAAVMRPDGAAIIISGGGAAIFEP